MAEPGGLLSLGSHKVGHDWSDLAAAAAAKYILTNIINVCNLVSNNSQPKKCVYVCAHMGREKENMTEVNSYKI